MYRQFYRNSHQNAPKLNVFSVDDIVDETIRFSMMSNTVHINVQQTNDSVIGNLTFVIFEYCICQILKN